MPRLSRNKASRYSLIRFLYTRLFNIIPNAIHPADSTGREVSGANKALIYKISGPLLNRNRQVMTFSKCFVAEFIRQEQFYLQEMTRIPWFVESLRPRTGYNKVGTSYILHVLHLFSHPTFKSSVGRRSCVR